MRSRISSLVRSVMVVLSAGILLGACGTVPPRVKYDNAITEAKDASRASGYLFRIRRSVLKLEPDAPAGQPKRVKITAIPMPLDKDGKFMPLYNIEGVDDLRSTTLLKVTYINDTKFIDEIGVKTTDNLEATIKGVSEVLQAAISVAAKAALLSEDEPIENNIQEAIDNFQTAIIDPAVEANDWTILPNNDGMWYKLTPTSESNVTAEQFIAAAKTQWRSARALPIAACSIATVEVGFSPIDDLNIPRESTSPKYQVTPGPSFQVTYADAYTVVPVALPSSGSVKMHPVCGANVTEGEKQDRTGILEYLKTSMDEALKVWNKWQETKKKPASGSGKVA